MTLVKMKKKFKKTSIFIKKLKSLITNYHQESLEN